jgi:hypothetical protein
MNLSFLPGNLHLTKNANGIFVLTMRDQEILSTKSQRSALARFNALRAEFEKKLPVHEPTAEEKAELLHRKFTILLFRGTIAFYEYRETSLHNTRLRKPPRKGAARHTTEV